MSPPKNERAGVRAPAPSKAPSDAANPTACARAEQRRIEFLRTVPASAHGIVEKALQGTASPRGAIKACCLTCTHFDRDEIRSCRVILCPLHAYRPFREE